MGTKRKGAGQRSTARERPGRAAAPRRRPARRRKPAAEALPPPPPVEATESAEVAPLTVPLSTPEPEFVTRVPPIAPERPRPAGRRAIFLDVENTSRAQHLAHVIDHLAVDRRDTQTDLVAVANWRVVGHEAARLLAQRGAHLVHSAPSTGVRDWSDLRLAVAAGIWLAAARPGDLIEIVSDDRAFDAVGDVAASLGIEFQRLSYRRLVKEDVREIAPEVHPEPTAAARSRRRRRRRGRGPAPTPRAPAAPEARPRAAAPAPPPPRAAAGRPPAAAPARPQAPAAAHTAPHDELVSVVRDLVATSPRGSITIDAVANVLKARGFQRPPGSPRLITRLRRIRDLAVSPSGTITLGGEGAPAAEAEPPAEEAAREGGPAGPAPEPSEAAPGDEEPAEPEAAARRGSRRRRRRRRGGGRRSAEQPAPTV